MVFGPLFREYETTHVRVRLDPETARHRLAERFGPEWLPRLNVNFQ